SALDRRLISMQERCDNDQLGHYACKAFGKEDPKEGPQEVKRQPEKPEAESRLGDVNTAVTPWKWIVSVFPEDGELWVSSCSSAPQGKELKELYRNWFGSLIYWLHHDYNQIASETLGMISDRVGIDSPRSTNPSYAPPPSNHTESEKIGADKAQGGEPVAQAAEWFWESNGSKLTLRWHGIHVVSKDNTAPDPEKDLLIESTIPTPSWGDAFKGVGIAIAVIAAVGLIVWALVRRIFLFHIAPLTITGEMRAAEAIREGRDVVILTPLISEWRPETKTPPLDLREIESGQKWGEEWSVDAVPENSVIEVQHFEHGASDPDFEKQKFILLERLLAIKNTQLVVVMTV